jgi:hypothetical protein
MMGRWLTHRARRRGVCLALALFGVGSISAGMLLPAAGTAAAAPAAGTILTPVFSDGFESGGMSGWRVVKHSGVQQSLVHTGSWAWRATNPNGIPSYAYRRLPASYNELSVEAWVYLVSRTSSVKLFAVRAWDGYRSLDVYIDQRNRVSVRNNIGASTIYSTTTMANGGWHKVALHAVIGTGSFEVSVDDVAVPGLSRTGQNLGGLPFNELRLGDLATAATFDIVVDDVVVSAPG